jgi:hypothetical protein
MQEPPNFRLAAISNGFVLDYLFTSRVPVARERAVTETVNHVVLEQRASLYREIFRLDSIGEPFSASALLCFRVVMLTTVCCFLRIGWRHFERLNAEALHAKHLVQDLYGRT